jgi:hypothetical protein
MPAATTRAVIFVSSVPKELQAERRRPRTYIGHPGFAAREEK